MTILIAGMNYFPNQFSRKIENYGCDVEECSGDPDGGIPTWPDAAIICKSHISHTKFDRVKQAFINAGKPVFIADHSFSTIKERVEAFLKEKGVLKPPPMKNMSYHEQFQALQSNIVRRPHGTKETIMSQAFKQAQSPPQPTPENDMAKRAVHTHDISAKVNTIVKECYEADMSNFDTIKMLESEGLRKASGESYSSSDISGIKYKLGLKAKHIHHKESIISTSTTPAPTAKSPMVQAALNDARPARKFKAATQLELIGKVMASKNLDSSRKLHLVEQIQTGVITAETGAITRKVRDGKQELLQIAASSIYSDRETPLLNLTKVQAMAIMDAYEAIRTYAEEN